ncbi:unnamed protein product, partial [Musa acuminata subsp. burmannicoides]
AACNALLLLGFSSSTLLPFPHFPSTAPSMAIPGPYSGVSTLAFVARASAFAFGVVYGSVKLSYLQVHQINLHSQKLKAASIGIFLQSAEGFMLSNVLLGWLVNQGDHFGRFCEAIIFFIVSVRFIEGKLGSR